MTQQHEIFIAWLNKQGYTHKSIQNISSKGLAYQNWLKTKKVTIRKATYNHLMAYIGYLQKQQKSKSILNENLRAIEHYYRFLERPNIAYKVRIRGEVREQPLLLDEKELNAIYNHYTGIIDKSYFSYSNKILVGLFIYQAVDVQELHQLEISDVNLDKGNMYLPAGIRTKNSRTVPLESHQIIALHHYITHHRNKGKTNYYNGNTNLLFAPQAEKKHRLINQCKGINKMLKAQTKIQEINYKSLPQLRQSRIALWIKQYGVRQAQYLSGRKRAKNIERLKQQDTTELAMQIEKYHPLR